MKMFLRGKQLVCSILFIIVLLAGCVPSSMTPDVIETSGAFLQSKTLDVQPLPTLLPTRTPAPVTGPQSTTNGYYATVHYTNILSDAFQVFWRDNYCIVSVAYGEGVWATTLDRHEMCGSQSIAVDTNFPVQEIEHAAANGSFVTSLAYGDDQWAVIVSQQSTISAQQINTYSTFPLDDILAMQRKGYWVTNIAYGNESWVVVFSKDKRISSQKIESHSTFPWEYIKREATGDLFLTAQAYEDNTWAIVLSNDATLEQDIRTQSFFSKDMVIQFWEDETFYYRTSIFYGENKWFVASCKELP